MSEYLDDILEQPKARRASTRSELDVAALVAKAIAACDAGKAPGTRSRTCLRCEQDAIRLREKGDPLTVPIRQAMSWIHQGIRYWAALCPNCADLEWSALWQRRYDIASGRNATGEMRRLVTIAKEREAAGHRLHLNLPKQAEHAAYEAR